MMITHPTPSQTRYRDGATACTAIAVMFGTWASECERIEAIPFGTVMEAGAMLWRSVQRRMPPPKHNFLEAAEVLQYGPSELVALIERTDFISGPMDDALLEGPESEHCMGLRRALERLSDANAGVFTRSGHSIALVRRLGRYYLFDSMGSTLAQFDALEALERYMREHYYSTSAFSLTLFRTIKPTEQSSYLPLRERVRGGGVVLPPPP
jgi:hypothetical protein